MNWKNFLLGAAVGFASAMILKECLNDQLISGEKALKLAKEAFKKNGPIDGSWIQMEPEDFSRSGLNYKVYKGGITRSIKGESFQYEFILDANTGSILEVSPL